MINSVVRSNQTVVIEKSSIGFGLKAFRDLRQGETVLNWADGLVCTEEDCFRLEINDHVVQISEDRWLYPRNYGKYINHSCEPNCGIKGNLEVVAMRDIKKGEWLTYDYEMTEDSYWRMDCNCGSSSCRKDIGAFANMPNETREKYGEYIADWLKIKYGLKH